MTRTLTIFILSCITAFAQHGSFGNMALVEQSRVEIQLPPPTYLIEQDCEGTGTPSGWTDSGSVNWDYTTSPAQGAQCAQFGAAGAEYSTYTISAIGDVWVFFAVRVDSFTAGNDMVRLRDGSSDIAAFRANTSGQFRLASGGQTGTTSMTPGTWYYVWIHYVKGTGADGTCDAFVSTTTTKPGSATIALSGTTATANITQFRSYGLNTTTTHSLDYIRADDVSIGSAPQ